MGTIENRALPSLHRVSLESIGYSYTPFIFILLNFIVYLFQSFHINLSDVGTIVLKKTRSMLDLQINLIFIRYLRMSIKRTANQKLENFAFNQWENRENQEIKQIFCKIQQCPLWISRSQLWLHSSINANLENDVNKCKFEIISYITFCIQL